MFLNLIVSSEQLVLDIQTRIYELVSHECMFNTLELKPIILVNNLSGIMKYRIAAN